MQVLFSGTAAAGRRVLSHRLDLAVGAGGCFLQWAPVSDQIIDNLVVYQFAYPFFWPAELRKRPPAHPPLGLSPPPWPACVGGLWLQLDQHSVNINPNSEDMLW